MAIVMNMSNYEIERSSVSVECSSRFQNIEWNPGAVTQLKLQQFIPSKIHRSMPADLATLNMEMFLQSMTK